MGAGFSYGSLGGSHHLLEDIAIMRTIPNIKIFLPSDEKDIDQDIDLSEVIGNSSKGSLPDNTSSALEKSISEILKKK